MSYIDVYFNRVTHRGNNVTEVAQNSGIRSFKKWLSESPHRVRNLSTESGLFFEGIILTNKEDPNKKTMLLNVALEVPVKTGDLLNWTNEDGEIEKWLLYSKEKKANPTFQVFSIIKCNYLLKWVDDLGKIQSSWCYFVSSMDSKIKENFRTWNSLITPQPNKYAEIMLPRINITRHTRFIIEDEGWYLVEDDHSSVPGITYMSLTEEKINGITDDLTEDLADTDKIAKFAIVVSEEPLFCWKPNSNIIPAIEFQYTVMKNGIPSVEQEVQIIPLDDKVKEKNGLFYPTALGTSSVKICLKDNPECFAIQNLIISSNISTFTSSAYISGKDFIRMGQTNTYTFTINDEITAPVYFSVSDPTLAKVIFSEDESGVCKVIANENNKLGTFTLTADYYSEKFTKEIRVIPLW